jgi:hypothetical protein
MTWYRSQPFGESQALDPRPCVGILADVLGIDLRQAADAKMTASEQGFPTSEVHGLALGRPGRQPAWTGRLCGCASSQGTDPTPSLDADRKNPGARPT